MISINEEGSWISINDVTVCQPLHRKQLSCIPHLGCVVVAPIGRPDGQPPVLLVLLPHVAGLVPHAVAVLHPPQGPGGLH